ncbi:hypothetical protein LJK88_04905 [Paenibacillus sp. P26]|nr:hypothetical protein LJK88_04905 [Paenibacillus sp. P26]UUZ90602.1 hypothetical protein LJK87_32630 [Paenibacillus sp. P25]
MNHRSLFTAARRRTNRQFFALTLPLLLLGLAVGCSSSSPAAPASADSQDSSQQTRVVKHLSGETKVPNHPSKIAVLDYRLADSAAGARRYALCDDDFFGANQSALHRG